MGSIGISKNRIAKAEEELEKKSNQEFVNLKQFKKSVANSNPDVYFIILDELILPVAFRNYHHTIMRVFFLFCNLLASI